jgi:hypothetical protein
MQISKLLLKKSCITLINKRLKRLIYLKTYRKGPIYRYKRQLWLSKHPDHYQKDYQNRIIKNPEYFRKYRLINREKMNNYWRRYQRKIRLRIKLKQNVHNEKQEFVN